MTNMARRAMVVLVVLGTVMMAGPANAQDATITLRVFNHAALSHDVLDAATGRVSLIYERIGVRIVWVESEVPSERVQDGRRPLNVLLLSRDMAEKKINVERIKDGVLGQALAPSGRAYIFCDRIADTPGALQHFPISLGDVIAHEVGHVLLGPNSHSRTGIMRANIDVRGLLLQGFDEGQALAIRTTLIEPTAIVARR
jgi:hypothetical protein